LGCTKGDFGAPSLTGRKSLEVRQELTFVLFLEFDE
jgi:hypothetical protein